MISNYEEILNTFYFLLTEIYVNWFLCTVQQNKSILYNHIVNKLQYFGK